MFEAAEKTRKISLAQISFKEFILMRRLLLYFQQEHETVECFSTEQYRTCMSFLTSNPFHCFILIARRAENPD